MILIVRNGAPVLPGDEIVDRHGKVWEFARVTDRGQVVARDWRGRESTLFASQFPNHNLVFPFRD